MTTALPSLTPLPARLAAIVAALCAMVAARGGRDHAMIPLVNAAWTRLNRTAQRFQRLVARVLAGRPAPVRRPGPARARAARDAGAFRLPVTCGWLGQAIAETRQLRGQVEAVLDDPAMLALLQAEPAAVRILRPLCRMLGIERGLAGCRIPRALSATLPQPPPAPPSPMALICAALAARPASFAPPADMLPRWPGWWRSD